jgi:hypothetical protein
MQQNPTDLLQNESDSQLKCDIFVCKSGGTPYDRRMTSAIRVVYDSSKRN